MNQSIIMIIFYQCIPMLIFIHVSDHFNNQNNEIHIFITSFTQLNFEIYSI